MIESQTEQWFNERVGKQICRTLKSGRLMNFHLNNESHAYLVFLMQDELGYRYEDFVEEKINA